MLWKLTLPEQGHFYYTFSFNFLLHNHWNLFNNRHFYNGSSKNLFLYDYFNRNLVNNRLLMNLYNPINIHDFLYKKLNWNLVNYFYFFHNFDDFLDQNFFYDWHLYNFPFLFNDVVLRWNTLSLYLLMRIMIIYFLYFKRAINLNSLNWLPKAW
jgi:hypothetical protein